MVTKKEENKKIVHLIHGLTSGGAETIIKDYLIELNRRGYPAEVIVFSSYPNDPNEKALREAGIKIHVLWPNKNNFFHKLIRKVLGKYISQIKLYFLLKDLEPNILHVHLYLMQYLLLSKNILENTKLFYTCHNVPDIIFNTNSTETKANMKAIKKFKSFRKLTIIALHEEMLKQIKSIFNDDDVVVLRNPVNLKRFRNIDINVSEYKNDLGIPVDSYIIGHIGRFSKSKQKNQQWLLKILEYCLNIKENVFLLMIGTGPTLDEIKNLISEMDLEQHVKILSDRSDIPQLLNIMDVFCLPSFYEGLPVSLIEAQAAGLKCVISDTITSDAIINDNVVKVSLDSSVKRWAYELLDTSRNSIQSTVSPDIFDIRSVVDDLLEIYFNF